MQTDVTMTMYFKAIECQIERLCPTFGGDVFSPDCS